jgi:hypothetical protein
MKIWFDTEFIDDGRTIDLISIGMVREDGETYYAENSNCDLNRASGWVSHNAIPHLKYLTKIKELPGAKPRWQIANDIREFAGSDPEFWAYFAAYDWVALCQLYGRMTDLPSGWPMYCNDVQQLRCLDRSARKYLDLPPMTGTAHNALDDAVWCKDVWGFLTS